MAGCISSVYGWMHFVFEWLDVCAFRVCMAGCISCLNGWMYVHFVFEWLDTFRACMDGYIYKILFRLFG